MHANNAVGRLSREICRCTRATGTFPDDKSALMLVTARLKYVAEDEWGLPPLPGCDAAGRAAELDNGPRGCRKVRKNLDSTYPSQPPFLPKSLSWRKKSRSESALTSSHPYTAFRDAIYTRPQLEQTNVPPDDCNET